MGVAGGPDEDGLFARAGLRQRRDGVAEIVAELLRGLLLDDSRVAHAQVHEIEGPAAARPARHMVYPGRPSIVDSIQAGERYGNIVAATRPGLEGEHRDIGAPRHAARGGHIRRICGRRPADDNAGDRGAVGGPVPRLVGRPGKEVFGHRLAGEHLVAGIDAGVDHPDGLAAAGFGTGTVLELELRVYSVGANRGQPPLVLEVVLVVVVVLDNLAFLLVFLQGNAAEIGGLDAIWRRRRRRRRGSKQQGRRTRTS